MARHAPLWQEDNHTGVVRAKPGRAGAVMGRVFVNVVLEFEHQRLRLAFFDSPRVCIGVERVEVRNVEINRRINRRTLPYVMIQTDFLEPTLGKGEMLSISALDVRAYDVIGWDLANIPDPTNTFHVLALSFLGLLAFGRRSQD